MTEELQKFTETLEQTHTASWEQFPDIELYMDQVVTYVGGLGGLFPGQEGGSKGLTASMVNNYVKDGYIRRPVNKKYGKEQLVNLYMLMMLKNVMPIPVLASSLKELALSGSHKELYDRFARMQDDSFVRIAGRIREELAAHGDRSEELRLFALQMTAEANAMQLAAERLMSSIASFDGVPA